MPARVRNSFAEELKMFRRNTVKVSRAIYEESVEAAYKSITVGSSDTGSRGQPVGSAARGDPHPGQLLDSWKITRPESWVSDISTDLIYAPIVEYGAQPVHSEVGGPHALGLTKRYWIGLVKAVVGRVAA